MKKHMPAGAFLSGWCEGLDAERDDGGCSADADEECGPVKPAYARRGRRATRW